MAPEGGVMVSMTRMNRIVELDFPNRCATVQPGLINLWLSQATRERGYFFAPDPSSQMVSSIGGNASTNAGGPHCLKYGITVNHVLGLEVVTGAGELVQLGGKTHERPGYDLTGVMVGAEGTLGLVTGVIVRLTHLPEGVKTILASFSSIEDASEAVSAIIRAGIIPAARIGVTRHAGVAGLIGFAGNEIAGFRARLQAEKDLSRKKIELVEGGEHRQQSVANAIGAVSAEPDDIVLVHDAVRPFVTAEIIHDVIMAARKYGAAIAGMPAMDTIKEVQRTAEGAVITATVPRERVVMAQTPQGFRHGVLEKAFDEATADGFLGTDEASLVERSGHEVVVVMGSPRNIKITTPADMELAEFFLKR
jgi:2-C-methyl-D-erythritol 4-phosphate cytidylyltransferase